MAHKSESRPISIPDDHRYNTSDYPKTGRTRGLGEEPFVAVEDIVDPRPLQDEILIKGEEGNGGDMEKGTGEEFEGEEVTVEGINKRIDELSANESES